MQKQNLNRKSMRLKGYDYNQPGEYFVTVCTKDRENLFSEIIDGKMVLNEAGRITEKCWLEIPKHFSNVELDINQIMPNHLHGILRILEEKNSSIDCRGAIHRAQSDDVMNQEGAMNRAPTRGGFAGSKSPMLNPNSLSKMIRWFKGRSTFEIRKFSFSFEWQRGFYDHIIVSENLIIAFMIISNLTPLAGRKTWRIWNLKKH